MVVQRVLIALAFVVILGVPFALRPAQKRVDGDLPSLIVVTPHVQQIRAEFGAAFSAWHKRKHGTAVSVDWRTPGGTTEIIKQLEAAYTAGLKAGRIDAAGACEPGTIGFDLVFGGGTYDHGRLKTGVAWEAAAGGKMPMSVPAGFTQERMDAWFGENLVGSQPIYDPQQYWVGVALSAFGIVYNRDVLARLGLPEPRTFGDLTDARYAGWVALADPRQSGSIATSFDSILSNEGWDKGWRVLREMCANTRYFTNSSTKPPIDVSAAEAAAGLAIDFYGRGQSQSVMREGQTPETSRVGYVDPAGAVYIDADPVSILRGGPNPEMAKRFVEFCLTEEGQALWQFHAVGSARGAGNPVGESGERMGPGQYELRRAPARRVMYEKYLSFFVDQTNPFELASKTTPKGWRSAIGVMMGAFAIDIAEEQRAAWGALNRARGDAAFPRERLAEMERLFYAWPTTVVDGKELAFTPETVKAVMAHWKKPGTMPGEKVKYTTFFRENYARVVELGSMK